MKQQGNWGLGVLLVFCVRSFGLLLSSIVILICITYLYIQLATSRSYVAPTEDELVNLKYLFFFVLVFVRGPTHVTQTDVWVSRGDTLSFFQKTRESLYW